MRLPWFGPQVVPTKKQMHVLVHAGRGHKLERVGESSANGSVKWRQGSAGAPLPLDDAVDKAVVGIQRDFDGDLGRVVKYTELSLKRADQHMDTKNAGRVV